MIQLLVCDVDGTLTDGTIIYGSGGVELKPFSVKDGLILKSLPALGIPVLLLTGRESEAVRRRASELGCALLENIQEKSGVLRAFLAERRIPAEAAAYIGDDLNDYPAMKLCGFKACPADSAVEIREICNYVSPYKGGCCAVRDIGEHILRLEGKYEELPQLFAANG